MADHSSDSELHPAPVFWVFLHCPTSTGMWPVHGRRAGRKARLPFCERRFWREVRALIESFLL